MTDLETAISTLCAIATHGCKPCSDSAMAALRKIDKWAHWCCDWDFLAITSTCPEFSCCLCFTDSNKDLYPEDEYNRLRKKADPRLPVVGREHHVDFTPCSLTWSGTGPEEVHRQCFAWCDHCYTCAEEAKKNE